MKKTLLAGLGALLALSACNQKNETEEAHKQAIADASKVELQNAVADRDQLFLLVNEISQGMDQIKDLENILTVNANAGGETPSQREQIQADIASIQKALQERREKLAELEKKLNNSTLTNNNLRSTIATLRNQIDTQSNEIESLKTNLTAAKARIGELNTAVDSLNTTVTTVTAQKDEAEQQSVDLANELNTCFYAVGSKKELKDNEIIETGFLRKTKIMEGDFDRNFFTTADKRTLTTIPLHSDKAKVLTNQPESSYVIEDVDGQKVLRITNPASFWSLSNYLVVQIN
ncbi:hypothetical protein [uncultured Duncaniella sp.]|jgi:septal ring factor EnvC (AmiA/AmiB activator)|uniref:Cbp1 family collagen-binding glycoprotein adhesin n=1 Tax=uncultured Duncaniella sp. TaxID=2768039 RepID=UPI001A19E670|nr:hypothetical protein [uncultured Duncaniella sp.]MBJ2168094.1 hypothetical protein [Muribaculaceae bacterium]